MLLELKVSSSLELKFLIQPHNHPVFYTTECVKQYHCICNADTLHDCKRYDQKVKTPELFYFYNNLMTKKKQQFTTVGTLL